MTNSKKSTKKSELKGIELHVKGIVQGVGFRPFIYNLAVKNTITGTVCNTSAGVIIQAYAEEDVLNHFTASITAEAPPLAQILEIQSKPLPTCTPFSQEFQILVSEENSSSATAIPPDIALCSDCLAELLSPEDRRHLYPFINCTNCGPRFTIVETIPYDRPKTSMKVFPMCPACLQEYEDPSNRRFHAQPNACQVCGPQLSWYRRDGVTDSSKPSIILAVEALLSGHVLAIRGLGGFHLSVNAFNTEAVSLLRKRKNRPTKPLAVMVKDIDTAKRLCTISPSEEEMLLSPEHPIVLLPQKNTDSPLADNVSAGVGDIGIMLPYTPLHHLLFHHNDCPEALVMTSGNISGHPICISNESAIEQLADIADGFLLHNREILTRVDDSVVKKIHHGFRIFRRSRGYCPSPLVINHSLPEVIGCGGGLKSTFCLGRDNLTFLSQHIGDLFNLESYTFYLESVKHHKNVFEIEPEVAVRDLHPDYLSSHFAESLGITVYTAQHHHSHAVAVMAEHGIDHDVLAIVLDGTGYGTDGTIWGGEILLSSLTTFKRLGHLEQLMLPGGDKAAIEPWRMAVSALYHIYGRDVFSSSHLPPLLHHVEKSIRDAVLSMMENDFNSPLTSSCGRLFDAVASLTDLRLYSDYEGHAAMELEALAQKAPASDLKKQIFSSLQKNYSPFLCKKGGKWEIISSEFVKMVFNKKSAGFDVSQIAFDFHIELICAISKLTKQLSEQYNIDTIVLSGGCMQNRLLMEGFFYALENLGLQVYTGRKIPVNDGGISFGQTIIGGLHHVSRNSDEGN